MEQNAIVIILLKKNCLYSDSYQFKDLFHGALKSQGLKNIFRSFHTSDRLNSSDYERINLNGFKNTTLEGINPQTKVVVYEDPSFISFDIKVLLDSHQNTNTLGLRISHPSQSQPHFDAERNLVTHQFFSSKWRNAYLYAGAFVCTLESYWQMTCNIQDNSFLWQGKKNNVEKLKGCPIGGVKFFQSPDHSQSHLFNKVEMIANTKRKPCLFLDRDGIINIDTHYPHDPLKIQVIPEIVDIIKWARHLGWWVVVVTNQAGIAKNIFNEHDFQSCTQHLDLWLKKQRAHVDRWFFCPDHPEGTRDEFAFYNLLRKPYPGMFLQAMSELPIDIENSLMIGDKTTDCIDLYGLKTILINKNISKYEGATHCVSTHQECLDYLMNLKIKE